MRSQYYPEQSNPLKDQYIFVYKVKITNQSPQTVQLVSRTWEIKAIEATEVRTYDAVMGHTRVVNTPFVAYNLVSLDRRGGHCC